MLPILRCTKSPQ
ncbi:hypothetical protein D021_0473A, partial [Vibrio parahaemolyticus 10296]